MDKSEPGKIIDSVREIIAKIAPDAIEKSKYGGLVFELDYLKPKRLFCGVFARKNYVTVEFDHGTDLDDPKKFLEGEGKMRRHLVLSDFSDIKKKNLENFIKQSFDLK